MSRGLTYNVVHSTNNFSTPMFARCPLSTGFLVHIMVWNLCVQPLVRSGITTVELKPCRVW